MPARKLDQAEEGKSMTVVITILIIANAAVLTVNIALIGYLWLEVMAD